MVPLIVGGLTLGAWGDSASQKELKQRRDLIIAAEEAIMEGDEAYLGSNFQGAVEKYREAFARIPEGEKTMTLKNGARERYAQAAVQAARVMNRQGDRAGAIAMVDEVLGKSVYPAYFPAQKMRAQLDDPIKTNPTASPEHARKVDEVRRLLYKAEGSYNLGKFDEATAAYEAVLRLDKYNKAARRGMERTNARISEYAGAAYDQARAKLLSDVSKEWELSPPKPNQQVNFGEVGDLLEGNLAASIDAKLDNIVIPIVDFDEVSLEEALEILEGQSRALDTEIDNDKKGVSFVLSMGSGNSPEIEELLQRRFSFRLRGVPLRQVLEYVTQQSGTRYEVDTYAISIKPLSGLTDDVVVRRYKVSPNFLSETAGGTASNNDPFGNDTGGGALLAPRLTAREYLEERGVSFPEGGSASYTPSLNELVVRTSSAGHDLVRQIVDAISLDDPIAVVIETKVIRLTQNNLEELEFDVALQNLANDGHVFLGGGTTGNGNGSDFFGSEILTSGLRSGDFATQGDPFIPLLNDDGSETDSGQSAAPGFLSLVGRADDYGLGVLLRGLNQKKSVDMMSQPSVITRSGQQADITVGRDFIYPTEYEPPEVPNALGAVGNNAIVGLEPPPLSFFASPSHPTAFETRTIGTTLEVLPTVSADRQYTDLAFNIEIDEFLGFVNYGEPIQGGVEGSGGLLGGIATPGASGEITANRILMPIFDTIRLNTNLTVGTGQTIIVGGLLSEQVESVEDKVPILGDIPFVGRLFSSDVLRREKKVVMVFVTVRIVDPGGNPVQPARD